MTHPFRSAAITVAIASIASSAVAKSDATKSRTVEPGIVRAGAPTTSGPSRYFAGRVTVAELVKPEGPSRVGTGLVAFRPGARSNWHTHPAGQTLYVTEGCGWTQREGGQVQRICKGDTVYVPAGMRHWHGATASDAMTHLSITETVDGRNVDWMEPVSDAQFHGPEGGAAKAGR